MEGDCCSPSLYSCACFNGYDVCIHSEILQETLLKILKVHKPLGTFLVVQWLRFRAPNAGGPGSIPGQGIRSHMHAATKSSHATTKEPTYCD